MLESPKEPNDCRTNTSPPSTKLPRTACSREGCERPSAQKSRHCSFLCKAVELELERIQRIAEAVGPSPVVAELWMHATTVGDSWSEVLRLHGQLALEAEALAITSEQWQMIKQGEG